MRHTVLSFAVLVGLAGCGDDDDSGGTGSDASTPGVDASAGGDAGDQDGAVGADAAKGVFPVHVIRAGCGQAGGRAIHILLGDAADDDACAVSDDAPSVRLEIWAEQITAPMVYSFAPGEANGTGSICPGGGALCVVYDTGQIQVRTFTEGVGATGMWGLIDDAGGQETGSYNASWCEPDPPDPPCV